MQVLREGIDDVFKQRIRNKIKQSILYKQHILHKNIEDFHFLTLLGSGSFGRVYLAELKEDNKIYAIKTINKAEIIRENDIDVTMAERRILAIGDKSTFLTQLYCSFQVSNDIQSGLNIKHKTRLRYENFTRNTRIVCSAIALRTPCV